MSGFVTRLLPFGDAAIAEAAREIAAGHCIAIPTETVYGLAADATNARAVAGIFIAKGRPSFNPLIVHVADVAAAQAIAILDRDALALAARFWPGPLTLVLPLRPGAVADAVTAGLGTVAIRISDHRAIQALLRACGRPLAAPSANASNRISPTRADHVLATLAGQIPLIVDDGPTREGLESTILRGREILRPGPVTHSQIEAGLLEAGMTATKGFPVYGRGLHQNVVDAPGQLPTHYAPLKSLRLNATDRDGDEWLIGFGDVRGDDTLSASGNLEEAAATLFDALYRADESERCRIAIAPIFNYGVGVAINDRLGRAARRLG